MITAAKDFLKRHWPALRLRTILLAVLLFAATMPAVEAVWLRGYENALVRQTEAELAAQAVALSATAAALWPGAAPATGPGQAPEPEAAPIDLNSAAVLADRPPPAPAKAQADPAAVAAAARLAPIFTETSRGALASIVMLDRHGLVVRGLGLGGDLSALPEVRQALAGHSETVLRRNAAYHPRYAMEWLSRASDIRLHYARPIVVDGQVVGALLLSRSPRALFRGVYEERGKMLLGAGVIIVLLIGLSGLASRGVTRPVEALSAATRAVAAGHGTVPETPPTAAIEIRDLYEDFRSMAAAIQRRSRYLRDFAAAVSHEFKTPLASIGGAVELLQDHYQTMEAADRERFLANIAADNDRLSHLVGRLLDLARADMAQPEADAASDASTAARRIADARSHPGFAVTVDAPPDLPLAAAPEAVLESMLSTLVDNSRQARASQVTIAARQVDSCIVLTVADDGPGVPAADQTRLFEPFFTTRRAEGGTGLGLPIARSLAEAHGGHIRLGAAAAGAVFELSLPVLAR
ncbi:sensor histidine kinase [Phenylobacterium montanum]|uniref:Signal transduction histidine-protein kinase/phosphatase MprB n=1 Tax=Phenylobacterium montanum TaxID=2823693 RepID=A0A975FYX1_9CAUL|nr:HAMP domain-containing sensor histidine kinase [Caulobacter sp. S6]QUD87413.1 HAMP domain-containing histidine kinase [Caulobacter sp. S6]